MAYFPMFIDLEGKKCTVAGGGSVAHRKVESLLKYEASVEVIAPDICEEIRSLSGDLHLAEREVRLEDLSDSFLVIAATDQRKVNQEISSYCRRHNIFVNVIDSKKECSFVFPATVKREKISIGVTTSGGSPVLSSTIRKSIEKAVPEYYGRLSVELGSWREELKERVASADLRKKMFRALTLRGIEQKGQLDRGDFEQIIKEIGEDKE
jgi:siroheme synthase-like protein